MTAAGYAEEDCHLVNDLADGPLVSIERVLGRRNRDASRRGRSYSDGYIALGAVVVRRIGCGRDQLRVKTFGIRWIVDRSAGLHSSRGNCLFVLRKYIDVVAGISSERVVRVFVKELCKFALSQGCVIERDGGQRRNIVGVAGIRVG